MWPISNTHLQLHVGGYLFINFAHTHTCALFHNKQSIKTTIHWLNKKWLKVNYHPLKVQIDTRLKDHKKQSR